MSTQKKTNKLYLIRSKDRSIIVGIYRQIVPLYWNSIRNDWSLMCFCDVLTEEETQKISLPENSEFVDWLEEANLR